MIMIIQGVNHTRYQNYKLNKCSLIVLIPQHTPGQTRALFSNIIDLDSQTIHTLNGVAHTPHRMELRRLCWYHVDRKVPQLHLILSISTYYTLMCHLHLATHIAYWCWLWFSSWVAGWAPVCVECLRSLASGDTAVPAAVLWDFRFSEDSAIEKGRQKQTLQQHILKIILQASMSGSQFTKSPSFFSLFNHIQCLSLAQERKLIRCFSSGLCHVDF